MYGVVKENYSETLYTLEEAKMIITAQTKRDRISITYYIKQKLSGVALIILSLIPIAYEGNWLATIFLVPLGLGLILTKEKVMEWSGRYE